ncbi:energy transducer TonB [Ferrimonas sp. SCSIO 43195]|uniref:energy transducer TonB n=1 Tax=Ferrimonas sp. SCSIO 43195 TaxID=2822844 RepID=UPI0020757C9A|nr:energy transducer TonB [Ferrimonas sp. SCSIO 43195]USD39462.1 TonB family protein [Ferrimonas sp. SCSIO 43195]
MIRRLAGALARLMLALPLSYLLVIWLPSYLNRLPDNVIPAATPPAQPLRLPPPQQQKVQTPVQKKILAKAHKPQPLSLTPVASTPSTVRIAMTPLTITTPPLSPPAAPALSQGLVGLSEVDTPPKLLHYIPPKMPVAARSQGLTGKVMLRLVVSETGEVIDARVQDAQPQQLFDDAALAAARRWRFKPAQIQNQSVSVYVDVPINFQIK